MKLLFKPVTIVICTLGRTDLMFRTLKVNSELIELNNLINFFNILIIDNNKEPQINIDSKSSFIYTHHVPKTGLSNARNAGINKSNSDYIWFIDDECVLTLKSLMEIKNAVEAKIYDFIGGPVSFLVDRSFRSSFSPEIIIQRDYSANYLIQNITGANFCVKKNTALELGGFNTRLGLNGKKIILGEENDLLRRHEFLNSDFREKRTYHPKFTIYQIVIENKKKLNYRIKREFASGRYSKYKLKLGLLFNKYNDIQLNKNQNYRKIKKSRFKKVRKTIITLIKNKKIFFLVLILGYII